MAEREEPKIKVGNLPRKLQIICKFWMMGNCNKDDKCEYLHNNTDFPSFKNQPNTQLPTECPMYTIGFCKNGPLCKFRHIKLSEEQNPYKDVIDNKTDDIENSEILPMWFLEYFLEKPIGLIFEEFENDNNEEIENMKLDLNIDSKMNIFDYKKLSNNMQQVFSNTTQNLGESTNNKKLERKSSVQNLEPSNISNTSKPVNNLNNVDDLCGEKELLGVEEKTENMLFENNLEKQNETKEVKIEITKNSENSPIKTSDSNSYKNIPILDSIHNKNYKMEKRENNGKNLNSELEIIEEIANDNQEFKIEALNNSLSENNIEINDLVVNEEADSLLKKMFNKYSFINFNFRNTNFAPNYNFTNANNYKSYINSTHFLNGYDLKLEDKEAANKTQQKNLLFNNTNNKLKNFGGKNNTIKNTAIKQNNVNDQKAVDNNNNNKNINYSNLGKSSFNREEISKYLLTKNYPNDIYAVKKISIIENLNLNVKYFFLRYKAFELIKFSMETDLLLILEENSNKILKALETCDEVILIYFDDISKDFYGFSKLKYQVEIQEVEDYLQEYYIEVLDIFQGQYANAPFGSNYNKTVKKKIFSFLQVEWLWKTKLSFDKVEILRNSLKNYKPFIDSEDGQEIDSDLGYYVCRLMIKRLTKDEVQEYLITKKQLEMDKVQTPFKNKSINNGSIMCNDMNEGGFNAYPKIMLSNNSNTSMNSFISDAKNQKFYDEYHKNQKEDDINFNNNCINDNKAFQQFRNNFYKMYNYNFNNKGNYAMNNMNKLFFNQFLNKNVNNQPISEFGNFSNNQFHKNLHNFYAVNNNNNLNNRDYLENSIISNNNNDNIGINKNVSSNTTINPNRKNEPLEDSKKLKNNPSNSFNSINIEKININSGNNLLDKFSQVSDDKNYISEDLKKNFNSIILEKINNYENISDLNNFNNRNNIINNKTNNSIIVTNISNLQVNISQNSYNNIVSENKNQQEKSKNKSYKDKKLIKSSSRSHSQSKTRQSDWYRKKTKYNQEKNNKNISRSKQRDQIYEKEKYYRNETSSHSSNENFKDNKFVEDKKEINKNEIIKLENNHKNKHYNKNQEYQTFDIFDKNDELNISKLGHEKKYMYEDDEPYE